MRLEPALAEAVERARDAAEAYGERRNRRASFTPPLGDKERAAVARMLRDGTYRRLADELTRGDAELTDL